MVEAILSPRVNTEETILSPRLTTLIVVDHPGPTMPEDPPPLLPAMVCTLLLLQDRSIENMESPRLTELTVHPAIVVLPIVIVSAIECAIMAELMVDIDIASSNSLHIGSTVEVGLDGTLDDGEDPQRR